MLFPDHFAPLHRQLNKVVEGMTSVPDVIMSRSTPFSSAVLGMKCAEYFKRPWIMHISDPLVDNVFFNHSPSFKERLNDLESACFEKASRVTVTSQQTVNLYERKYPQHGHKLRILPNVFDEADLNNAPVGFEGTLNLVFTGRLYGYRRVHEWLDAVEEATKRQPELAQKSKVSFVGYFPEDCLTRIQTSKAPQVKFLGPAGVEQVKKHQRDATVLVCLDGWGPDPRADVFFPSKLQDYLAAGRKTIGLARSTSTVYEFLNGKYGWCFDQHELSRLPDFLIELFDRFKRKDASYFKLPPDFMEYGAQHQAKRLEQLFEEVVQS
jgi:glycosyltransferase involved in cell wall biosynthesis